MFEDIYSLYNLSEKKGYDDLTLSQTEKRLTYSLPLVLKQYYSQLGLYSELNTVFNQLVSPEQLNLRDSDYLIFYEENQGVVLWAIASSELSLDDPPVYGSYDNGNTWVLDASSLSNFFVSMAYLQAVMGGLPYTSNTMQPDKNEIRLVKEYIANWHEIKGKNHWYNQIFTRDGKQVFFIMTDAESQWQGIFLACQQEEEFEQILDTLLIDWSYISDEDEDDWDEE
ncbi:hypothetical protein QNI16_06680 [Cytophagaceae bacterium YF14B1]|uniref:SMI1/KNR4 family protein n=1 Tax=Xanthocytophaga flava TaxID=3048013 RepID=A0AAE3QIX0_9BACT|nr:hypothetical protein [Xanthocytophaga flavus]MDJ1480162.1 hypothetical protein [Xanthocytophaga flavus]